MRSYKRICQWLTVLLFLCPLTHFAATPVKSMVLFGDSMSDNGNTTHLLKTLRQEADPSFIVTPFKAFVLNKMVDFANEYYVPQMVLDAGIEIATEFFDHELAFHVVNLISRINLVPLLPGKPYWNNRFSNGRVWDEYLASMFSIDMMDEDAYYNRAFAGSWIATYDHQLTVWNLIRHPIGTIKNLIVGKLVPPSLGLTVQAFLMEHPQINPDAVYFIFSGGNDYLNALKFEDNYDFGSMSNYIDNVLNNLTASIFKLTQAGAKRFVIMGVPPLADTPKFSNTNDREVMRIAVETHNNRLQILVREWQENYPKADFLFIDTHRYAQEAIREPQKYGFTNTQDACIDVKLPMLHELAQSPFAANYVLNYAHTLQYRNKNLANSVNYTVCDTPDSYMFWDEVHPSTRAHYFLAYEVCNAMKMHGYAVTCDFPYPG